MAPLMANERTRALKGLVADEADKEGVSQVGLDKVLWVLPLHVSLLELLVWKGDQAVETLIGTKAIDCTIDGGFFALPVCACTDRRQCCWALLL